ncbi:MAG: integrase [Rhodocyclales bacterium]|nr:integrase [Rhodocyclales bacterium]
MVGLDNASRRAGQTSSLIECVEIAALGETHNSHRITVVEGVASLQMRLSSGYDDICLGMPVMVKPAFFLPMFTAADIARLRTVGPIKDPEATAVELKKIICEQAKTHGEPFLVEEDPAFKPMNFEAPTAWKPSTTDIQRGRKHLLQLFEQDEMLPVHDYAKLADKSRQQIYKDIAASPPRLLALDVGKRGQRFA